MDTCFGPYRLKRQERVLLGPEGPVDLSARSFDILGALLEKPGEVIGKEELFEKVWPGVVVEENTLQVHISALRKVLKPNMVVTVHGRGYKYAGPMPAEAGGPAVSVVEKTADRKPIIVVLPFENLSGEPSQQYFSDGITQDIIDRLTRFRMISVAGQHASSAFRDRGEDPRKIAEALAADYLVTGNVRRSESRIRIAARLTDYHTGSAVWAEHFDRPLEDVFAMQDEVAALIASTLMGRVEVEAATRPTTDSRNVTSYDLVLRGIWHFKKLTVVETERAAELFKSALDINPANAEALRWLSACCINRWLIAHDREQLDMSVELGRKAAELDPASALCHTAHALALIWAEGCEAAAAVYRKAHQANPDDPHLLAEMGLVEIYRGHLRDGLELLDQAEKRNPMPPLWYAEFRAIAAFASGRYADALPAFAALPESVFDTAYAVACMGHLGDAVGVARAMKRVREAGWNLQAVAADEPFADPAVRQLLFDGLAKACVT